jgi:alanyl-tRNA synthetase
VNSSDVRRAFFRFFEEQGHQIVPSAPMVLKDDPTLMFTNAGMNQFKDMFLGNAPVKHPRIANTQKCLRVSGKHNDLEEVGVDTYHHTMFEMLGNWSFGDYFKQEAIAWAWKLLTEVYKVDIDRMYATVFEGDASEGLEADTEALQLWKQFLPEDRILFGNKKDNFWEMGDTGPCGPCSEIHVDIRTEEERKAVNGRELVNMGHPQVIEIWNLVFMQFNRMADGSLKSLPARHVDTGMGLERLCMVLQAKRSNYDTDVFSPIIQKIEDISGLRYRHNDHGQQGEMVNIAMRVIADHIRAISFAIADGQLPANTGAGYVIRRILRRAVRYGYQTLNLQEPFLHRLVPVLAGQLGEFFPELGQQKILIEKVIREEETAFYRTLEQGLKRIDQICIRLNSEHKTAVPGNEVFELYDTFGFPLDLTALIAKGYELEIDMEGFNAELEKQKARSRAATTLESDDWVEVRADELEEFVGYDYLETSVNITRYRRIRQKGKELYQLVLNVTPFYPEGGGQVGDTGLLVSESGQQVRVVDTKRENNLIVHFTEELPADPSGSFQARVDGDRRSRSAANHSATHLMHFALREALGTHVEQKGSLVSPDVLRFDFSHFAKVTDEELKAIERRVNDLILANQPLDERRRVPLDEAMQLGAMALFGEKYGDVVRVIRFGQSVELCGGTHVPATGNIGMFRIVSESSVAAGIRRIEAVTGAGALEAVDQAFGELKAIREQLKNPKDVVKALVDLQAELAAMQKELDAMRREKAGNLKDELMDDAREVNGIRFIARRVSLDANSLRDIAFQLRQNQQNLVMVLGSDHGDKPTLAVLVTDDLIAAKGLNAGNLVRDLARDIQGGGGGQPFFATAGGKEMAGLDTALGRAAALLN